MKTRHGLQIKQLLQKKHLSKSRFNPESQLAITSPSMKQSRQVKKCQSTTSLHVENQKREQRELETMERRYQQLYDEYKKIVEEQRKRTEMCKKQGEEIEKYGKAAERDRKEIERLRSMVGFISKNDSSTQTVVKEEDEKSVDRKSMFGKQRKSADSRRDSSARFKKSQVTHIAQQIQTRTYSKQSRTIAKSRTRQLYPQIVPRSRQISSQKKLTRRYEPVSSKLTESLLYGSKSSVEFRKRHLQKTSELFVEHTHQVVTKSRINSPNARFKFVPTVEI